MVALCATAANDIGLLQKSGVDYDDVDVHPIPPLTSVLLYAMLRFWRSAARVIACGACFAAVAPLCTLLDSSGCQNHPAAVVFVAWTAFQWSAALLAVCSVLLPQSFGEWRDSLESPLANPNHWRDLQPMRPLLPIRCVSVAGSTHATMSWQDRLLDEWLLPNVERDAADVPTLCYRDRFAHIYLAPSRLQVLPLDRHRVPPGPDAPPQQRALAMGLATMCYSMQVAALLLAVMAFDETVVALFLYAYLCYNCLQLLLRGSMLIVYDVCRLYVLPRHFGQLRRPKGQRLLLLRPVNSYASTTSDSSNNVIDGDC
jgi:hypothetical protein